jgi:single-strand DNA-binding protein
MASLNKVLLIGNLTREPELRYTSGGAAVCGFGLAMNRRYSTASGEQREEVCFIDVDVWGKQGESCKNYLRKGAPAFIEGRLRMDTWQDRESGKSRSRLTVTAERVQFLGAPRGEFGGDSDGPQDQDGYQDQGGYQQGGGYSQQPPRSSYQQPAAPQRAQGYAPQPASQPPRQAYAAPNRQQGGAPPPPQMPAFEEPNDGGDALDDIPF